MPKRLRFPASPARGSDRFAVDWGILSSDPPRAQEGDEKPPCCWSSLRDRGVSWVEMPTQAMRELRPDASQKGGRKEPTVRGAAARQVASVFVTQSLEGV